MNSVPLTDVLPWGDTIPSSGRTILICDSAETDGRFLLYTIAAQCLQQQQHHHQNSKQAFNTNNNSNNNYNSSSIVGNSSSKVFWIHCGCSTDDQIRMAVKKASSAENMSSSTSSTSLSSTTKNTMMMMRANTGKGSMPPIQIMNIMQELSNYYLTQNNDIENRNENKNEGEEKEIDLENIVKKIYIQLRTWIKEQINNGSTTEINPLIIIDNASLLSNQIGSKLTHVLIQKIQNLLLKTHNRGCLTILCSGDFDQEYYLNSTQQSKRNTNVTGGKIIQYIGGGGRGILCDSEDMAILNQRMMYELEFVWERSLIEMVDGIIDVMPLASGFARDVHGRLVFTERPGSLGWKDYGQSGRSSNSVRNRNRGAVSVSGRRNFRSSAGNTEPSQNGKFSTTTVNYCCNDAGVRAIRLQV